MTDFLVWLIISSFWIWGFYFCARPGQILGKMFSLVENMPLWIKKPIYKCPMCMSSVHGTALYVLSPMPYLWYMHLLFMVALCGLNDIIDGLTADYE